MSQDKFMVLETIDTTGLNIPAVFYFAVTIHIACDSCEAGKFKTSAGVNIACDSCEAGKFKGSAGVNTVCDDCEAGTYSSSPGSATCASCPTHSTTAEEGSDELTDCKCNAGFSGPDGGACVADGTGSSGDGTCVPFHVSGATVCVPEHLTPAAAVEHCSLSLTWKQIRNGWSDYGYVTGGLGKLMIPDSFEVWLCASSPHPCAAPSDPVCFTFSEIDGIFVPWGFNSTLDLGRKMKSVIAGRRRSFLSSKPSL